MSKIKVDKSVEFEKRLSKIHGLGILSPQQIQSGRQRDIRREELRALVDVFLGKNYDRKKFRQLDGLQKTMRRQQAVLIEHYEGGYISSAQFFDLQATLFAAIFREIKKIIGARDYRKLFGTSLPPNLADRKTFLNIEAGRKNKKG